MLKLISKYKIFLYIIVITLIVLNLFLIGFRSFINTDDVAPIFIIYTQKDNDQLEKLFTDIQNIETTDKASYMYLDKNNKRFTPYQETFNLNDMEDAFIVINRKQEVLGIKTPCPDYNFIEKIIKKYDY